MTDLHEKVSDVLYDWKQALESDCCSREWGSNLTSAESIDAVTNSILALLPKVSGMWWHKDILRMGRYAIGRVKKENDDATYYGWFDDRRIGAQLSRQEARAAVERAVREALGWEA